MNFFHRFPDALAPLINVRRGAEGDTPPPNVTKCHPVAHKTCVHVDPCRGAVAGLAPFLRRPLPALDGPHVLARPLGEGGINTNKNNNREIDRTTARRQKEGTGGTLR